MTSSITEHGHLEGSSNGPSETYPPLTSATVSMDDASGSVAGRGNGQGRARSASGSAESKGSASAAGIGGNDEGQSGQMSAPTPTRAGFSSVKKRSKDEENEAEKKPKKTRQTQSCDACRARKVKCDRPPPGTAANDLPTKDVCSHCRQLGMQCTFDYKPKKRGPPNMYLKRMQALNQASAVRSSEGNTSMTGGNVLHAADAGPGPGTLATQNALHRSALSMPGVGAAPIPRGPDAVDDWAPALTRTIGVHKQRTEQLSQGNNGYTLSSSFLPPGGSPPSERTSFISPGLQGTSGYDARDPHESHGHDPHSPYSTMSQTLNPIEAIIPRPLLMHLVELYFDYVYCLVPCLHKPSFMRDLHNHREERPGQQEWVALVFAVVEATLVQMPRSFVSLPKREIKILFSRAYSHVKSFLDQEFHTLTVSRNIILYFHGIAAHHMGNPFANDTISGENYLLSLRLRLHEESSYQDLNPIERELRKRIFWLQYGGDKTISAIDNSPVLFHEVDCGDVTLPSPLDDEFLTEDAYLEQPEGHTPVLAGFYYISKLFRLLGQVLDKRRSDRAKPPSGVMLQMRINEVEQIFHQVMGLMDNCPEALKLDTTETTVARAETIDQQYWDAQWDAHVSADIRQLVLDPSKANRAVVKDGFLVQQANIYVTQQMVRYIVLQYREELGLLQDKELQQQSGLDDKEPPGAPSRRMSVVRRLGLTEADRDQIASDLLVILSKIRMEVIAVNSVALVTKVRFIASTLLDGFQTSPSPHASSPEMVHASERATRVQGYLWDFLRILSDIEALYVMDDDD